MGESLGKLVALTGVASAALLLATPLGAGGVDPQQTEETAHDSAVGGFERANGAHTAFSAHSDSAGASSFGHLSSTFDNNTTGGMGTIKERFSVVCLAVAGNEAAIGLVPTGAPPDNAGTPRVLSVQDGGLPGGDGDG